MTTTRRVEVAREPGVPGSGGHLTRIDCYRLTLCLSGLRQLHYMENGRPTVMRGEPGDGLFIASDVWLLQRVTAPYESLGVVFLPGVTRFVWTHYEPDALEPYRVQWHHIPAALDDLGVKICASLALPARGAERQVFEKSAFEVLKCELIRYLRMGNTLSKAEATWQSVRGFVEEHYASPLDRDTVAQALHLHPDHVSRLTQRFGGCKFGTFLLRVRLERARVMLQNSEWNIAQIAHFSGFSDANHFSRVFREHFHQTPTQARGRLCGAAAEKD